MTERKEFFADLAVILKKHNVVLNAVTNGTAYGMHLPLIEFDFVDKFDCGEIEMSTLDAEYAAIMGDALLDS